MIITLTGPTASGKSTLEKLLVKRGCRTIVSTTTRPMRAGEINGKHYHFVSDQEFDALRETGGLVEHLEFGGYKYGVSLKEMLDKLAEEKPVVVVCEPVGQKQIDAFAGALNQPILPVFVDGPVKLRVKRVIARLIADALNTELSVKPAQALESVMKSYSRRLAEMATTEAKWIEEAERGDSPYEVFISRFAGDNQKDITDSVMNLVKELT
jgi:guanylate kinase